MSLQKVRSKIENLNGVEVVVIQDKKDWKGTVLEVTLTREFEGKGEEVLSSIVNILPKDVLDPEYNSDERISIYEDSIQIKL